MKLTNDSYVILIHTKSATERYYRDKVGWLKVSTRRRKFRATSEQVLNHLLPALAGLKPNLTVELKYRPRRSPAKPGAKQRACGATLSARGRSNM
jgi:hypothetical protein